MTSLYQRAGKTAPRFLHDIDRYDPDHPPASGRNLLADTPPVFADGYNGTPEWLSPSACQHTYKLKPNQTSVLSPEQRRGRGAVSIVSAFCSKCRCHLQMRVAYTGNAVPIDNHLHHLVCQSASRMNGTVTPQSQRIETYYYACSYPTCGTTVSMDILSALLRPEFVQLLTDVELVNKRADEAIAAHPDRLEGIARPQPITILTNLSTYIHNALYDSQRSKPISSINKRFVVCFGVDGQPCKDLLTYLGFSSPNEGFWDPPRPDTSTERPFRDELSIFLDNAIHELSALIEQRPPSEKKIPYSLNPLKLANAELLNALEAANYSKASRLIEFQMAGWPCYEDLGVLEDMSSDLIIEAYHRQVAVDPGHGPRYLQCLRHIAQLRGGPDADTINEAVMFAYSKGAYTTDDVWNAYRYFDLNPNDPTLADDVIIGRFHAYLSSTTHEAETRQQLLRIGEARKSEHIKSAAEDKITAAEQALVFLGVEENTPDDFIITMYTTKVNDSPSSKPVAQKALSLIADARNSEFLRHFLRTGESGVGEMDVGDAYRLLQIPDRTASDDSIIAAYTICIDDSRDSPDQMEVYSRALRIIANEKNSSMLSSYATGSSLQTDRDLSEWPVGLQNIGNTCYLNSLLQFYFTVRPYREMVLDFENNKTDLDEASLHAKKVGSRKVSKFEVERSQKFLRELRTLFQNMIRTPRPFVRPEQELARLTLISSTNEAEIRRRSTISGRRPFGLGEINGMTVAGPLGPPQSSESSGKDAPTNENTISVESQSKDAAISDIDSETTLVSEATQSIPQAPPNIKSNQSEGVQEAVEGSGGQNKSLNETSAEAKPEAESGEPPNRPPPVPPRPAEAQRSRQIIEEVELGAQQDVTEVINNVLFQSECAIRPRGIAPDGEQMDQVKDLFYGRTKSYITAKSGIRSKEEIWSDIKVDVASGPRDIYSAIDGAFDIQEISVDGALVEQFGSISKLPPVLQIQVQRVQFDPVKKTSFKSTHHLELKDTIYLDRYMDTQKQEIIRRRKECWEWKKKLKELDSRKAELLRLNEPDGQNMPALFKNTSELLGDLSSLDDANDVDIGNSDGPHVQLALEMETLSQISQTELAYIEQASKDTQTMISSQFSDYKRLAYCLYAVFMHQGSVEFGHYYIYIYDFKKEVWRKYNDNEITEVRDTSEIFGNQGRVNPPTPYFLVYVNAGMKDRLVEPVCREIIPEPSANPTGGDEPNSIDGPMDVDVNPPSYGNNNPWARSKNGLAGTLPTSPWNPSPFIPKKKKNHHVLPIRPFVQADQLPRDFW
ncbi:putative ubiquitin hydrolase [Talaromyces proteolyticus]|uniref:ubiquitinyl hydrolase 1 n=1 Tax=Talaromyces proteolyticus TaxID=1131652 RepID=A0AAD4KWR0_9EURO|nr:putative ubiquitin hydrolase [Talaromyces proteolyticus]KAH8701874.1 putative ubiquitin hydrolase [Talaromyces proteolyticus]